MDRDFWLAAALFGMAVAAAAVLLLVGYWMEGRCPG